MPFVRKRTSNLALPLQSIDSDHSNLTCAAKMDLYDGYLGDATPLCTDWPSRGFLRRGARYTYLGTSPLHRHQDDGWYLDSSSFVSPPAAGAALLLQDSSDLYRALCNAESPTGPCRFELDITLSTNLPCNGRECHVDSVIVVQMQSGAETVYFEHIRPACVELAYHDVTLRKVQIGRTVSNNGYKRYACADPRTVSGGAVCCSSTSFETWGDATACEFPGEYVTYATAEARCAAQSSTPNVCFDFRSAPSTACAYKLGNSNSQWIWVGEPCAPEQVAIHDNGAVTYVQPSAVGVPALTAQSGNDFRVRWVGGDTGGGQPFPTVSGGCETMTGCIVHGAQCVCDVTTVTSAAFTDVATIPTVAQIEARLRIGAVPPDVFDAGTYVHCVSAACTAAEARGLDSVRVYTLAASAGSFDEHAIFRIVVNNTVVRHLANKESTVMSASAASLSASLSSSSSSSSVSSC